MVINSVQYSMNQSIVSLLALLTAPVELLAESKFLSLIAAVSKGIATALNNSPSYWQQLDALLTMTCKEFPHAANR